MAGVLQAFFLLLSAQVEMSRSVWLRGRRHRCPLRTSGGEPWMGGGLAAVILSSLRERR
jgi:hypothetical protein